MIEVYSKDNANSITDKLVDDISELFDYITQKGTGWSLKKIHDVFIETYDKKLLEVQVIYQLQRNIVMLSVV